MQADAPSVVKVDIRLVIGAAALLLVGNQLLLQRGGGNAAHDIGGEELSDAVAREVCTRRIHLSIAVERVGTLSITLRASCRLIGECEW